MSGPEGAGAAAGRAGAYARGWSPAALAAAALAHAVCLGGGLLDADRLLLVRNPQVRAFSGLFAMLHEGAPVLRAGGLSLRNHAPLGVLSVWLGWQWLRASPLLQHAVGLAALLWTVGALLALLAELGVAPAVGGVAALSLALHPITADLTGPILGRDALFAVGVTLYAARRARAAGGLRAAAWSAGAALVAGLCVTGWGLLGLVAAAVVRRPRERAAAVAASLWATALALAVTPTDMAIRDPLAGAAAAGDGALLGWLPGPDPLVIATAGTGAGAIAAAAVVALLVVAALWSAARAPADHEPGAALLRAAGAALIAFLLAGALGLGQGTIVAAPAFLLHFGVVLALAGVLSIRAPAGPRPWVLVLFLVPALVTAIRLRGWADEDRVLEATVVRDADDPEALLARARQALRRGALAEAAPWCLAYGRAAPATFRADGCVAALASAQGNEALAEMLLHRWALRFDDRRALRAAVLEVAYATHSDRPEPPDSDAPSRAADPRFAAAFQRATGLALPARRAGDP